jgi:hypothetical protein
MVFRNCAVARIGFLASTGPMRLENGMACEPNYFLGLRASTQKTLPSSQQRRMRDGALSPSMRGSYM